MTDIKNYLEERSMANSESISVKGTIQDLAFFNEQRVTILNELKEMVESGEYEFFYENNDRCIRKVSQVIDKAVENILVKEFKNE